MTLSQVESKVQEITRNSKVLNVGIWDEELEEGRPWERQKIDLDEEQYDRSLPSKVDIILSNMIYIEKNDLSASIINRLRRLASFQNPDFYKKLKRCGYLLMVSLES